MFKNAKVTDMGKDGIEHKLPANTPHDEIHSTLAANGFQQRKGADIGMYHNPKTGKKAILQKTATGNYVSVYEDHTQKSFLESTNRFIVEMQEKIWKREMK
jgi:topoisomerase IA-like protein